MSLTWRRLAAGALVLSAVLGGCAGAAVRQGEAEVVDDGGGGGDSISPKLNTKRGEIPARLQRVASFPAVLKEHTLHELLLLLEQRDYSVATQAQLMTAKKLIEQTPRLMEKVP